MTHLITLSLRYDLFLLSIFYVIIIMTIRDYYYYFYFFITTGLNAVNLVPLLLFYVISLSKYLSSVFMQHVITLTTFKSLLRRRRLMGGERLGPRLVRAKTLHSAVTSEETRRPMLPGISKCIPKSTINYSKTSLIRHSLFDYLSNLTLPFLVLFLEKCHFCVLDFIDMSAAY